MKYTCVLCFQTWTLFAMGIEILVLKNYKLGIIHQKKSLRATHIPFRCIVYLYIFYFFHNYDGANWIFQIWIGNLPEALRTKCARCSNYQKEGALRVITKLYYDYPEQYSRLRAKWDPSGEYHRRFEEYLRGLQFNVISNENGTVSIYSLKTRYFARLTSHYKFRTVRWKYKWNTGICFSTVGRISASGVNFHHSNNKTGI